MTYIGIDNGITGAIAIIQNGKVEAFKIPTFKALEYTKKKQVITRVDVTRLIDIIKSYVGMSEIAICYIERPMVNPKRFKATKSALRCLEATLIALEELGIPYKFIDSKEWQKAFFPSNTKEKDLKFVSLEIVRQRFGLANITDSNISDAILIAKYCEMKEKI